MTSLLDMLDAIERDKPRAVYCTQNNEDCATCTGWTATATRTRMIETVDRFS